MFYMISKIGYNMRLELFRKNMLKSNKCELKQILKIETM